MITRLTLTEKKIMEKRGFADEAAMLEYLNTDPDRLPAFSSLKWGSEILEGMSRAIAEQKMITIYGDYDADGVMAMTILYKGLSKMTPGHVNWFANERFRDGYSITPESLGRMLEKYPDTEVIITCDNGIGAVAAWNEAIARGLTVYVTDHHEQGSDSVLNPSIPAVCEKSVEQKEIFARENREAEGFCGAELARRFIWELYEKLGVSGENAEFLHSLYAYAGVATIADVICLNASNHSVVRTAIDIIRSDTGFWKLYNEHISLTSIPQERVDGDTFGFYYSPAINACSRVRGSIEIPMRVFLHEGDEAELVDLIETMAMTNQERKDWTEEDKKKCMQQIEDRGYENDPFILVAISDLREGINGLSATEIVNKYGVPAIVISESETPGIYKGSARSVDSVNIFEKLSLCSDLLMVYGGHPKAGGLTIRESDIDEFRRRMIQEVERDLVRSSLSPDDADFTLNPGVFTLDNIREMNIALEDLLPFGEGFKKPVFYLDTDIAEERGIFYMSNGEHARLTLAERSRDNLFINLMMWKKGAEIREINSADGDHLHFSGLVDVPQINEYGDRISYQIKPDRYEISKVSG